MYSFTAPKYTVTVWFNPCNPNDCPINVQDRIGWLGEGMTDSDPSVIDTSGHHPRRHLGPHPRPEDPQEDLHADPRRHPGQERQERWE